ncbi:hypothetical protein V6N13_109282 [Hibiscus sabdariffa]
MMTIGDGKDWVENQIKENNEGISWITLKCLFQSQQGTKHRRNIFTLSIYGLVIFPKDLWGMDPKSSKDYRKEQSMDQKGNNTYLDTGATCKEVGAIL